LKGVRFDNDASLHKQRSRIALFSVRGADVSIKPWGVSPRSSSEMSIEPAKRAIAVALNIRPFDSAAAHFAGFDRFS
jgi:hypothetical protein